MGEQWRAQRQQMFSQSKIVDFKTGKPVETDETFMDAMLEKIAREGEQSLSRKERKQMDRIAKKKQKG